MITPALELSFFLCDFSFSSFEHVYDRRTDKQTDGYDQYCGPLGRPKNKPNNV